MFGSYYPVIYIIIVCLFGFLSLWISLVFNIIQRSVRLSVRLYSSILDERCALTRPNFTPLKQFLPPFPPWHIPRP